MVSSWANSTPKYRTSEASYVNENDGAAGSENTRLGSTIENESKD